MRTRTFFQLITATIVALTATAMVVGPAGPAQAASSGPWYLKPYGALNLCVQPQSESSADLTKLELATCRNVGAQKWWFRDSVARGAGYYLIVNGASHKCMNVKNAGGAETPVVLYPCSDALLRQNDIFKPTRYATVGGLDYYELREQQHNIPLFSGRVLGSDLITRDAPLTDGHNWTWVPAPS